ncbi:MAG: hypothetical protein ABEI80_09580 [Haloplanus sp.]
MSTDASHDPHPGSATRRDGELWLDRFARCLGFGWLAARLPGDPKPSYVYAVTTVVVATGSLVGYNVVAGVPLIYEENPYFALLPLLLLGSVYGSHALSRQYDRAMDDMRIAERASDPTPLLNAYPSWLPWVLFGVGATVQLIRSARHFGLLVVPVGVVKNVVVYPFVYTPILAQFAAVYLAIEFFAPLRLYRSDVGINFLDPEGVGGLRPLGELIKRAYYYIVAGLVAGAFITYAPLVESAWQVFPFMNAVFTSIWIVSIGTVGFAVLTLHRFMYREKRAEKSRLEAELLNHIENPWDMKEYEIPEDKQAEVEDLRQRMDRISATREYPATFSIWTQLLLSIVLPKAVQLFLSAA